MKDSVDGPQEYRLFVHEFKVLDSREKSYAFAIDVEEGKAIKNGKISSRVALDLVEVLRQSKTGLELMNEVNFQFTLDRQFILRVTRKDTVEAEEEK